MSQPSLRPAGVIEQTFSEPPFCTRTVPGAGRTMLGFSFLPGAVHSLVGKSIRSWQCKRRLTRTLADPEHGGRRRQEEPEKLGTLRCVFPLGHLLQQKHPSGASGHLYFKDVLSSVLEAHPCSPPSHPLSPLPSGQRLKALKGLVNGQGHFTQGPTAFLFVVPFI